MTASKSPKPEPRPDAEAATQSESDTTADLTHDPTDHRDDDATTEILTGLDADRTPTEVLDGDEARATAVLPDTGGAQTTEVLAETSGARATRVLPETAGARATPARTETPGLGNHASPEASAARPGAHADLTPPPAPRTPTPAAAPLTAEPALRARVRWAGIIWGLVFAAAAITLIWVLAEPERRESVGIWWAGLTPAGLGLTALIVAGGLLLIGGLTGLARHLSTRSHA